ncbi:hydroxyacylglutathione hydrolase [Rhodobacterales bacterium 52_120_T64]|nr:hydroxyacylglutathione hydrolase [Rhodobacterales bacterium 52_120_T64]
MTLEIVTIPCLADNYAFLLRDRATGKVALVDAPESYPIQKTLRDKGWHLDMVLLTHHHNDHIDGLPVLVEEYHPQVIGAKADANRLPPLDLALNEGDTVSVGESMGHIIDVSGHTIGHIAFHFPSASAVFTADSLMALGCGRLFEGTPEMMWASLSKLAALPSDTIVYSGHEYTASNAKFALTVEPQNAALQTRIADITAKRAKGIPTVPSSLAAELATNPFLRAHLPAMKTAVGMEGAPNNEVFAAIRKQKDIF